MESNTCFVPSISKSKPLDLDWDHFCRERNRSRRPDTLGFVVETTISTWHPSHSWSTGCTRVRCALGSWCPNAHHRLSENRMPKLRRCAEGRICHYEVLSLWALGDFGLSKAVKGCILVYWPFLSCSKQFPTSSCLGRMLGFMVKNCWGFKPVSGKAVEGHTSDPMELELRRKALEIGSRMFVAISEGEETYWAGE